MLSTSSRFTQTLDPSAGVARPADASVVAASVAVTQVPGVCVTGLQVSVRQAAAASTISGYPTANFGGSWTAIERKPMPKVDLHPDRWPLQSTS